MARQNTIFLAVLCLPPEVSHPWLRDLLHGYDAADTEDALVALAFDGEAEGRARFRQLSQQPCPVDVRALPVSHELRGREGTDEAREHLRSYRAIEVFDRVPYFKITPEIVPVHWRPHPDPSPDLERELLQGWLRRYPGHPGSDDMALRLGRNHGRRGEHVAAVRWYARSASLPDQDVLHGALAGLVTTAELFLSPEQIDALANERGLDTPSRTLLQYVFLRRIAAGRSMTEAVRMAAALAADEPGSSLSRAWARRLAAKAPRGLKSGLVPVADDDPLRFVADPVEPDPPTQRIDRIWLRWGLSVTEEERLQPPRERLRLDTGLLAAQFRAWETLAELEGRTRRSAGGARADLLYQQAAIYYHDPRVLFPVYGYQSKNFVWMFQELRRRIGVAVAPALERFERESYGPLRALAIFRHIEGHHADYAGMDKVLFSQGILHHRLLGYGPFAARRGDEQPERVRAIVGAFEQCALRFPRSPLADDAERAIRYWRRVRPEVFWN